MRRSTRVLGVVAFACALAAGWFWHELRDARLRVDDLERRLAETQIRPVAASGTTESAPASAGTPAAALDGVPLNSKSHPTPGTSAKGLESRQPEKSASPLPSSTDLVRNWQERERVMMRDPAYRQAQMEEGRQRFAQTRADAIRVVGMTPEQADRVIDLWVERNLKFNELGNFDGSPPSPAAQAELNRAAEAERAELRQLLGDDKLAEWQQYLSSGEERAEVQMIRARLSTGTAPLADAQSDALVKAIYSERRRRSQEYDEYLRRAGVTDRNIVSPQDRQRWLDLEKEANQRIHDSVAGTLSNVQLAAVDEALARRLVPIETALRMQLDGSMAKSN